MGVAVAAGGHHEPLPGVVQHLGLSRVDKGFCALFVTHIDELAVFHGKSFRKLIVFGSKNLPVDHKVRTLIVAHYSNNYFR